MNIGTGGPNLGLIVKHRQIVLAPRDRQAWKRDSEGKLIGHSRPNPILYTALYEVEFDDGTVEAYHANIVAEHIFEQVDDQGFTKRYIDEIIDHKSDQTAIQKEHGYYNVGGTTRRKRTTRGWRLLVRWKDGTTSWGHLKDVKNSNPLELAEYAVANSISIEPAFAWWVPYMLRQRTRVIKALKKRYFRTTHKFGIELPKTVKEAFDIDDKEGNTFWRDAIKREMKAIMPAFEFVEDDTVNLVGFTEISREPQKAIHRKNQKRDGFLSELNMFVCCYSTSNLDVSP